MMKESILQIYIFQEKKAILQIAARHQIINVSKRTTSLCTGTIIRVPLSFGETKSFFGFFSTMTELCIGSVVQYTGKQAACEIYLRCYIVRSTTECFSCCVLCHVFFTHSEVGDLYVTFTTQHYIVQLQIPVEIKIEINTTDLCSAHLRHIIFPVMSGHQNIICASICAYISSLKVLIYMKCTVSRMYIPAQVGRSRCILYIVLVQCISHLSTSQLIDNCQCWKQH